MAVSMPPASHEVGIVVCSRGRIRHSRLRCLEKRLCSGSTYITYRLSVIKDLRKAPGRWVYFVEWLESSPSRWESKVAGTRGSGLQPVCSQRAGQSALLLTSPLAFASVWDAALGVGPPTFQSLLSENKLPTHLEVCLLDGSRVSRVDNVC